MDAAARERRIEELEARVQELNDELTVLELQSDDDDVTRSLAVDALETLMCIVERAEGLEEMGAPTWVDTDTLLMFLHRFYGWSISSGLLDQPHPEIVERLEAWYARHGDALPE